MEKLKSEHQMVIENNFTIWKENKKSDVFIIIIVLVELSIAYLYYLFLFKYICYQGTVGIHTTILKSI